MAKFVSEAPIVWNLLNGVVCLYKSAGESARRVRGSFLTKLCLELNALEVRPPSAYVAIEGKTDEEMAVTVRPSYADNPLVVGPRYRSEDFRAIWATKLGFNTSGVFVIGLNNGTKKAYAIHSAHPMRTYRLKGCFGQATDNIFKTGKVIETTKFHHIRRGGIERHLAMVQASHQRLAYESAGVDPQSQEAYDLAVKGLVRPQDSKTPIIYGARCIDYSPPEFTIEISCINEYEDYLLGQIQNMGLRLHSAAMCTSIQCIHHSFFKLEDALLKKHWKLQDVIANLANSNRLLKQQGRLSENINKYVARST
uniref:Putative tRNA pseudouridine synthase 2 n=1 Tax=Lygus hesperus TaxID=30085 RepID=A0A146LC00_LYGHE